MLIINILLQVATCFPRAR